MERKWGTVSYAEFIGAWSAWLEYYQENNPCPYAISGECPEPCPVAYQTRLADAVRLWESWYESLPEEHWLMDWVITPS